MLRKILLLSVLLALLCSCTRQSPAAENDASATDSPEPSVVILLDKQADEIVVQAARELCDTLVQTMEF